VEGKGSQLHVKGVQPCGGQRDERGLGRMDKRLRGQSDRGDTRQPDKTWETRVL
jgi:hypothetical protein